MVEISEIVDRESLEAWLGNKPVEVSAAIATRAAIRVLPRLGQSLFHDEYSTKMNLQVLGALVCTLAELDFNGPATKMNARMAEKRAESATANFRTANSSYYAASSIFYAAVSANTSRRNMAADSAAYSVSCALEAATARDSNLGPDFWKSVMLDVQFVHENDFATRQFFQRKNWNLKSQNFLDSYWEGARNWFLDRNENWEVWFPIYESLRDGAEVNWEGLQKIAEIPNSDWGRGPVHINGMIARIMAEYSNPKPRAIEELSASSQHALRQQVSSFLENSHSTVLTAGMISVEISSTIHRYMSVEKINQLPPELQVFERLAATLAEIKGSVASDVPKAEKFEALQQRVLELEAENGELQKQLAKAENKSSFRTFLDAYAREGGKQAAQGTKWLVVGGSAVLASLYLPGEVLENLAVQFEDVCKFVPNKT